MSFPSIDQLDINGKRVFLRVDLDVPLAKDGSVKDDSKLRLVLPTIEYAVRERARLIIASHLGEPGGRVQPKLSLEPVGRRLSELLDLEIILPESCIGDGVKKISYDMMPGSIMLLENLKFHKGECSNDPLFAKRLASVAEVYVNDAFSLANLPLASTVALVSCFEQRCIGFNFKKELESLSRITLNPERPFVAVLGGKRVEDKIGIMEALLPSVDTFLLGGTVANTFLRALGRETGKSVVDRASLYSASRLLASATARDIRLLVPQDVVAVKGADPEMVKTSSVIPTSNFPKDYMIVDIGPETVEDYSRRILGAKTVLWCGPVGIYQIAPFDAGTNGIARSVAESGAYSVAVGDSTVDSIKKSDYSGKLSHLSSGGSAAVEFIRGNVLPALKALSE
jgi:phosphoglycerate kinase